VRNGFRTLLQDLLLGTRSGAEDGEDDCMSGIKGKVVAITGASSGIGEATALLLAERGARLVLGVRRSERLAELAARIEKAGGAAVQIRTDVTRRDDAGTADLPRPSGADTRGTAPRATCHPQARRPVSPPAPVTSPANQREIDMSRYHEIKFRAITSIQRRIANPINRRLPFQTLLETTGRTSGLPRRTPVGGRRVAEEFWLVSEYGEKSQYIRNIKADPKVRVRVNGRWHNGTAHLLPEDDARTRLKSLPRFNSGAVRAFGTSLLTVRVDLTD
jgi:deazaflavin-dependent oxidoreductase (nitroreductase family)